MNNTHALLSSVFGFDSFRPGQEAIVDAVNAGEDVLAIMPTGGGKSLCFQLPALCRDGVTVVISPLIALMRDQVRALREAGVEAGSLTSGNTDEETEEVFQALDAGRLKLLYMAPERLANGGAMGLLSRINVSLLAVDEAHCVSQWGHDFRPDYLKIGALRKQLNGVQIAAFTATADAETRVEIGNRLFDGQSHRTFLEGFDRPNITLAFQAKDQPRRQLIDFVAARKGQSGIVYCSTRNKTEVLAQALRAEGHVALHYHAGMDSEDRRHAETRFQREDGLIVCATVAFGMGIDKPDIRYVVHADLPKSIESYYQEIGRAGRDGAPADTLTLYGADDIRLRRSQIDEGLAPNDRKGADHTRLNALLGLAEALKCRRQVLLAYFGDDLPEPCGNCDLCATSPEVFDGTDAVRKALSAILRTGERFGAGHLTDILLGNETDKIRARRHDILPTFGVGKDYNRKQWQTIFRQMMGHDLIRPDVERMGGLVMTETARPILRGETRITLRLDTIRKAGAAPARRAPAALIAEEDAPVLSALKRKRRELAEEMRAPAYVVFPDKTLIEMATHRPVTLDDFSRLNGVGAKKLEKYGKVFLEVLNDTVEDVHPTRRKLAGKPAGDVFDQLKAAQIILVNGPQGTEKPMSCSTAQLAKIAGQRPDSMQTLARIINEAKAERFGDAFLEILHMKDM
ncbi:MAG: DNA helicase RecQ [Paracoccaceae bacterium]